MGCSHYQHSQKYRNQTSWAGKPNLLTQNSPKIILLICTKINVGICRSSIEHNRIPQSQSLSRPNSSDSQWRWVRLCVGRMQSGAVVAPQKSATIDWHHLECAEDFDTTGWCLRTYRTFGQIERASPIGRVWIVGCTSRPLSAAHHLQIESIHIRF